MPIPHHTGADGAIPHQTAADGVQYAVSTKVTAKDDRVTDNDVVDKGKEDHEVLVTVVCVALRKNLKFILIIDHQSAHQ